MALDFTAAPPKQTSDFIAVVLVGPGNQLAPLTTDNDDDSQPSPKALLPIANQPMVDYTLTWLESSGITDVLLLCPARHRPALAHHIHSDDSSSSASAYPSLTIDIAPYDDDQAAEGGPCAVLRAFAPRIPRDFVLLPCDLVPPPDLPLSALLSAFRVARACDDALMTALWVRRAPFDAGAPDEWGVRARAAPVVWDPVEGTLLYVDAEADTERADDIELRMALFSRFPRAALSTALEDTHAYVCRRAVLDLLARKPAFESWRDEFVPWLCRLQYERAKQAKYAPVLMQAPAEPDVSLALRHSTLARAHAPLRASPPDSDSPSTQPAPLSAPSSPTRSPDVDDDVDVGPRPGFRVGVLVHRTTAFSVRTNTLPALLEANRHFLAAAPSWTLPTDPKDRALIDAKAQIASDAIVGASTRVGERALVKRSVVGRHCVVAKHARVVGCVLMDHCVIEEGAKLEGCVLGAGTKVGAKADLVRVVTQAQYEVDAGETIRNEKLEASDWAAGGGDDDDDDDEDGSEDGSEEEEDDD